MMKLLPRGASTLFTWCGAAFAGFFAGPFLGAAAALAGLIAVCFVPHKQAKLFGIGLLLRAVGFAYAPAVSGKPASMVEGVDG